MRPRVLSSILAALALVLLVTGVGEALIQQQQDEYVRAATREALEPAAGRDLDFDSKVVALRDFVRARVRNVDFSARGRPFLRDSAADTLRTGKGRCGEATRVFVNMARAAGIPAQRLYLEGRKAHVVAVVMAGDGRELVIDVSDSPYFPDTESVADIGRHTEFETYSTFGWRRLSILRALPSNLVNLGPLSYAFENPHALIALLCLLSAAAALASAVLLWRRLPRRSAQESADGFVVPNALEGKAAQRGFHPAA